MKRPTARIESVLLLAAFAAAGCGHLRGGSSPAERSDNGASPPPEAPAEAAREAVLATPVEARPEAEAGFPIWRTAVRSPGKRIIVSIDHRALWLMDGDEPVLTAPIAVGMEDGFVYQGRQYYFETPRGTRKVLAKATTPVWVPPDWHYFEKALEKDLKVVQLRPGSRINLSDETRIEVRGDQVGRVNQFDNFWPFTPGTEIIFDGTIFVPPFGTAQRRVPEVLGTHKLELGDGYLIHGTNEETSIGEAVSHGCVRMYNEDVARLYELVGVGTPVFIY